MTGKTTIEWTHAPGYVGAVWNPTVGCTRVSAGCDNCYAFALHDQRYAANRRAAGALPYDRDRGPGGPYTPAGARALRPELVGVKGGLSRSPQYDLPFSRVQLLPDRLDVPLRTRKATCYFVDSMADLFHQDVPDEYIDRVWGTMSSAARHTFLILTKRPERMRAYVSRFHPSPEWDGYVTRDGIPTNELPPRSAIYTPKTWPLPNVWLGTSVEDQRSADERIPHLLATPAAVRFLSCEPLLGPVDLKPRPDRTMCLRCGVREDGHADIFTHDYQGHGLDWVIIGGESGPRARPMDLAWARSLVAQCRAAGVAPFVKQLGARPVDATRDDCDACRLGLVVPKKSHGWDCEVGGVRESHGGDMDEWPHDLRIREWPAGVPVTGVR